MKPKAMIQGNMALGLPCPQGAVRWPQRSIQYAWYFKSLFASLTLITNLLLGCAAPLELQSASIHLRFACRRADLAQFSALAEQFHFEHPTISVTVTLWPNTILQAATDQASLQTTVHQLATQADAFMWFSQAAEVGYLGLLKDLTPFLGAEERSEQTRYYPTLAEQFHVQSAIWGLPAGLDPFVLVYNPAIFTAAGIPPPTSDWDWDDLLASARRLTQPGADGTARYGFSDYELDAVTSVVAARGGLTGEIEPQIAALRWYTDLALSHGVMPNPAGQQLFNPIRMAGTGEAAMVLSPASLWLQTPQANQLTLRIAPLPTFSAAQVYGYFISAGSAHPQAAYEWISFISDKAVMRDLMPASPLLLETWARSLGLNQETHNVLAVTAQHLLTPPLSLEKAAALKRAATLLLEGKEADAARSVLQQAQSDLAVRATVEPFVVTQVSDAQTPQITFVPLDHAESYTALAEVFSRANFGLSVKVINAWEIGYDGGSLAEMLARSKADCFVALAPQPDQVNTLRDLVLPLQAFVEADRTFPWADYFPHALAQLTFEDGLWGIPAGIQPWVLWYDRSIFDRSQMAYPSATWTWNDLLDAAQRLASQGEEGDTYGFLLDPFLSSATLLEEMVGIPLLDSTITPPRPRFTEPASREAVRQLQALVHAKVVPLRKPGADSQLFFDLVRSNRLAMWRGSAMAVPPQPDGPLQPALLPKGMQSASCYNYADSPVWAYYISAQSQHVQASWLWIRFLADQLPVANYLTPRRSLLASDTFRAQVGAEAQAVYQAAADCRPATSASSLETALPHAWRARIWLAQALDAVMWQDADADIELAAAQHKAEAYLACYQTCPDPVDVKCAHTCMIATDPATEKLFLKP